MTPVTRSDSSGAHFIHDLGKDLKAQGTQLVLCDPTDTVRAKICTQPKPWAVAAVRAS
jgi:anti-anti-sigma regulatory factor